MADEGEERRRIRRRRMDLNLYLGLSRSPPRLRTLDPGYDLNLSSLPLSVSSSEEIDMSTSNSHPHFHVPYSPSHASFAPDQEDTYFPSTIIPVPRFAPVPSPDSEGPIETNDAESPPRATEPSYDPLSPDYFLLQSWSYIPLDSEYADVSASIRPYRPPPVDLTSPYDPPLPPYLPPSLSYVRPVDLTSPYDPPLPPSLSYVRPMSPVAEWLDVDEEPSPRWDRAESTELRFRRWIRSNHRRRVRRLRSSLPYPHNGRLGFRQASSPEPEPSMLNIMSSQRSLASGGKHTAQAGSIASDSSGEGKEDNKSTANFECNICLDMAEDPVVTSCGHLFCWPCLYRWLHVHSEHKECPVCKGEVTECNITPIYGRASSGASDGKKLSENRESDLKIPARPRGNRLDSLRQQLQPIPRRSREGMFASWRHPTNFQIRNRNRFDALGDPSIQGLTGEHLALLNRVRAGYTREALNPESRQEAEDFRMRTESNAVPQSSISGEPGGGQAALRRTRARLVDVDLNAESEWEPENVRMSSNSSVPHVRDRISLSRQFSIYDSGDTGRVIGSSNRYGGASASSLHPWRDRWWNSWATLPSAADQGSASSTAAMVYGDAGHPDDSVEPNSRGFA